jgi:peptide/nickel transport system permease protein
MTLTALPAASRRPNAAVLARLRTNPKLTAGLAFALVFLVAGFFGKWIEPFNPSLGNLNAELVPAMSGGHILGTNQIGQDVFSQLIAGVGWSLGSTAIATALSGAIGVVVGLAGALSHGLVRRLIGRVIDFGISIPYLVIAVAVLSITGRGFFQIALTLGFVSWPSVARVVGAQGRSLGEREFVLAASLLGASLPRRARTHILPNLRTTLLVMVSINFSELLLAGAALSYLGLGGPITTPNWGNMLATGQQYLLTNPWMLLGPAIAIFAGVFGANLLADGLADAGRG